MLSIASSFYSSESYIVSAFETILKESELLAETYQDECGLNGTMVEANWDEIYHCPSSPNQPYHSAVLKVARKVKDIETIMDGQ